MLTRKNIDARMLELSNRTSDLLVGLKCLDIPEVKLEAMVLKERAFEYGATLLAETAKKIEQAADADDLETVQLLIPELNEHLKHTQQALCSVSMSFAPEPAITYRYAGLSVKI